MSRFLIAMFVGATIATAVSTSASAYHCLASAPNGASARPSGSYLKGRSQSQCAGAYIAAVGLVAKSHGADRTRIFSLSFRQRHIKLLIQRSRTRAAITLRLWQAWPFGHEDSCPHFCHPWSVV